MPVRRATTKSVSFGEVDILEFPIILGENPAVSGGAPIEIGWELLDRQKRDVQLYEYMRGSQRRLDRKSFVLSASERARMLKGLGYTKTDIESATLRAEAAQKQRTESLKEEVSSNGLFNERMINLWQTTGRLPMNVVKGVLKLGNNNKSTKHQNAARSA